MATTRASRRALFGSLLLLLVRLSIAGDAIHYSTIEGYGGVPLVVAEAGNPDGPPILFVHGFSQSILSWKYQLNDPDLGQRHRLVALDLRGHGASGKPWEAKAYGREALGGDIQAVISAKALDRPVLVGWSYGGEVLMTYLRHHGSAGLRGMVFVGTATSLDGPLQPPDAAEPTLAALLKAVAMMGSADVEANLEGTRLFLASLTAQPLSSRDMEEALTYNMLTPAYVRTASHYYLPDNSDLLGQVNVPTLIVHGGKDPIAPPSVGAKSQHLIPGSRLLIYENAGHAPFLEMPQRFNQDLAAFVGQATEHKSTPSPLAAFFGNTWVYTADDGTKYVYLDADGRFTIVVQDGSLFRGRWTLNEGEICFHVAGDAPSCFTDLAGRKLGRAWQGSRPHKRYAGIIHEGRPDFVRDSADAGTGSAAR